MTGRLDVRVLGPFQVRRDRVLTGPEGGKRRAVLALLALRANHDVPVTELIDGVWGEEPPASAANLVQTYVSAWRKALQPGRPSHGGDERLITSRAGYRLSLGPEESDLTRFTAAVAQAKAELGSARYESAAARLSEALGLWRGPPLSDLTGVPFQAPAAARLDELRLDAVERWAAAALECGMSRDVAPVLLTERDRHPLRERLTELLMWALWQDHRQNEALAAYEALRRRLADDLGTDPAAGARQMHARVLRQDPHLAPDVRVHRSGLALGGPARETLTLLMTDVEGSTRLWADEPDAMNAAMRRHHEIIHGIVADTSGWLPKDQGEGDAIFAAFRSAIAAVGAAAELHRALAKEPWPTSRPLRVRVGMHVGEVVHREGNLFGDPVNRCARIRVLAAAGQTLLSDALHAVVHDRLGDGLALTDLGEHRLKDVARPERIWQLTGPGLEGPFPPVRGAGEVVQNLPVQLSSFVGRDSEMAQLTSSVRQHRLVTLTGLGGVGKTRLAIETAGQLADGSIGDVWFVDLSAEVNPGALMARVAEAIGVRTGHRDPADAVIAALCERPALLVLDNLEHLLESAPTIGRLLERAPRTRVLATSRERLRLRGEHVVVLAPLELPDDGRTADAVRKNAAVRLFEERAAAADPRFALTPEAADAVHQICRRLDGLPLAIELAASRVRVLPPRALLARLDRALDVLATAQANGAERHGGLRATIDSSYRLLPEVSRNSFRAYGVFRGGWNLAAATAITERTDELAAVADIEALLDASLIEVTSQGDEPRFRMLETLRDFARERLAIENELELRSQRHAQHFVTLVADAEPRLIGPDRVQWLDRLEADRDNVVAALQWMRSTGDIDRAARTATALWRFWQLRGHLAEGRAVLESVLAEANGVLSSPIRADVLTALGNLAYWQRDYDTARQSYAVALDLYEQDGAPAGVAQSYYNLGFIAVYADQLEHADRHFTKAWHLFQESRDSDGASNALAGLALVDRMTGAYDRARQRAGESLAALLELGDEVGATNTLGLLGSIEARRGDFVEAERLLRDALNAHHAAGNVFGVAWMLHELAATAAVRGRHERALRLRSAARKVEGDAGGGIRPEQLGLTKPVEAAVAQLDPGTAERADEDGQAMSPDQAVQDALGGE